MLLAGGCALAPVGGGSGSAKADVQNIPTNVKCIVVTAANKGDGSQATGGGSTGGQSSMTITVTGLQLAQYDFTANAYDTDCSDPKSPSGTVLYTTKSAVPATIVAGTPADVKLVLSLVAAPGGGTAGGPGGGTAGTGGGNPPTTGNANITITFEGAPGAGAGAPRSGVSLEGAYAGTYSMPERAPLVLIMGANLKLTIEKDGGQFKGVATADIPKKMAPGQFDSIPFNLKAKLAANKLSGYIDLGKYTASAVLFFTAKYDPATGKLVGDPSAGDASLGLRLRLGVDLATSQDEPSGDPFNTGTFSVTHN
jgi:hypothetical protein